MQALPTTEPCKVQLPHDSGPSTIMTWASPVAE